MKCFLSPAYREDMAATTSWHTLHFQLSRGIEVCKQWSARLFDCLWFKLHMLFCGVIDGDIISLFGKSASHAVCEPFLGIDKKEMLFFLQKLSDHTLSLSVFLSVSISVSLSFSLSLNHCFAFPIFFPPSQFLFIHLYSSLTFCLCLCLYKFVYQLKFKGALLTWEFLKTCLKAS